jgi:hypothetical protein
MSFETKTAPTEFIIGGVRYVRGDLHDLALSAIHDADHVQTRTEERKVAGCEMPSRHDITVTLRRLALEHKTFRSQTRVELRAAAVLLDQQAHDLALEANSRTVLLSMINRLQAGSEVECVVIVGSDEVKPRAEATGIDA